RTRQIQPEWRDGWKQALTGQRSSLPFRLTLDPKSELYKEALAELFRTRDAAGIARLLTALGEAYNQAPVAERILRALGDRRGDLYEPALKLLKGLKIESGPEEWLAARLARLLARADSKRAHGDFVALLKRGSP